MNETFSIRFFIPNDMYTAGIKYYFRKKTLIRDMIFSGIFLILSIDFLVSIIKDSENKIAYALLVVCISCIFMRLFITNENKKRVINAALELNDETELKLFEDRISIRLERNEEASEVFLDDKLLEIYDYNNMFIISEDFCYIVPKDAFGEHYDSFVDKMKELLEKRYIICK